MIISDKKACICILDVDNQYRDSYSSWLVSFMRDTFFQEKFDVFIATTNSKLFGESSLNKFLTDLQLIGKVDRIFPIQFNLNKSEYHLKLLEMGTLCENFREVNQTIYALHYSWYYQITPDTEFDAPFINSFGIVFGDNFFLNSRSVFFTENSLKRCAFSFFMTGDRHSFGNLQNLLAYVESSHNTDFKRSKDVMFYMKKLMYRQNTDYLMIDKMK